MNVTTGVPESICVQVDFFVNSETCGEYPATMEAEEWRDLTNDQPIISEILSKSIGCKICEDFAEPYVEFNEDAGIPIMNCKHKDTINSTAINEPCGWGEITAMTGVIPALEELKCVSCSELIPNCTSCNSTDYCTLCTEGYRSALIKDSDGVDRSLCLAEFCGVKGTGDSCKENTMDNCIRSSVITFGEYKIDHCN